MTERTARIVRGAIKGARRGGPAGVVLSLVSGAAVVFTLPGWIPFVASAWGISMSVVAAFAAIGAVLGAVLGALREKYAIQREDREFNEVFKL